VACRRGSETPPAPIDAAAAPSATAPDAAADAATAPAPAPPPPGRSFDAEMAALFRIAACGSSDPLPPGVDPALVEAHCKEINRLIGLYRAQWLDVAMPFIARILPKDRPPVVVYPFGGGDIVSALATYPDAKEFTTVSLEPVGDARGIDHADTKALVPALQQLRLHIRKLFEKAHSRTDNLGLEAKSVIPGEVAFALVGLHAHGLVPVSMRYFLLEPDGALRYLTDEDVAKADASKSPAAAARVFRNVEIRFRAERKDGLPGGEGDVRGFRHMAMNLSDKSLQADPSTLRHLEAKGNVAVMTKAASHLLWLDDFSMIRNYLIQHMAFMISDTTGLAPRQAKEAGFVQDLYGRYEGPEPFGKVNYKDALEFKKLFKEQSKGDVSFRYGYPDHYGHGHIVVTRRP
jgi:hypothetical protein